ncbi:uncharacterized protein LOC110116037 [Dendrobium catenatum]|uniref:uncharacterized protein LOC110116037 n=1 Tax=Dendrobium catenatum TaxID=906689 RepID=UPI0009F5A097|nr:uncharacterized protein LOC110116037 [Dendrobium catenatum]
MGDLNCYRDAKEKSGGNPSRFSRLEELNGWIFSSGTIDLNSISLKYTWFNGHANDPINIKLDRMLVNHKWLETFPLSYYKVIPPGVSDHSPLILMAGQPSSLDRRFQFKNYWLKLNQYWDVLISSFSTHHGGSLIANLYGKLKVLKANLKLTNWSTDHFIKNKLEAMVHYQKDCIESLQRNPLDPALNSALKTINKNIAHLNGAWCSWIFQRAKANWLSYGEDDLSFLYARINTRSNSSRINKICTDDGHFDSPTDIAKVICGYFQKLYNPPMSQIYSQAQFCRGDLFPSHLTEFLLENVTDAEIKQAIFGGPSASAPGPDVFSFEL